MIKEFTPEALEAGEEDFAIEGLMLAAQVHLDRLDFALAIPLLEQAVGISGDSKLRARAQFSMAECYEKTGNDSAAAEAYSRVEDFSPDLKFAFQSRLRHGMCLAASGKHDEAFDVFDDLSDEDLLTDERGLVEVEVARNFLAVGDTGKAFPLFEYIDTTYKKSDPSARSAFFRGEEYQQRIGDYKLAGVYYDRARSENAASGITPLARRNADNIGKYLILRSNLEKYDSLLYRALHPDTSKPAMDSLLTDSSAYSDTGRSIAQTSPETATPAPAGELAADVPAALAETGGDISDADLFFAGEEDPPKRGNLHRGRGPAGTQTGLAGAGGTGGQNNQSGGPGRSPEQSGGRFAAGMRVPSDAAKLAPDSLRSLMRQNQFELGGLFLLELQVPESAKVWYRYVVDDSVESVYKPRAYYALAEIYRSEMDTARLDSAYAMLVEKYPETEYGRYVRRSLGQTVSDSTVDSGLVAYAEAEKILMSGDHQKSIASFKSVAGAYPRLPAGIKALYTTGWIFENLLFQNDSAAAYYRILVDSFPTSEYSAVAKPKLAVKAKPETLSQYVRIKEIQAVPRSSGAARTSGQQSQFSRDGIMNDEDPSRPAPDRGRGNKGVEDDAIDEDVDQPDEPETEEPDPPEEEDPDDGGGLF
jgi:tetratricopeptide (TPR) repeat protein